MGLRKLKTRIKQKFLHKSLIKSTGSKIHPSCILPSDLKLGKNCIISEKVIIRKNVILADGVKLGRNAIVENVTIGAHSEIESGVLITGSHGGKISIGENSYIGVNNILDHSNDIIIGNFVHIAGPSTGIWTHSSAKMCLNAIPLKSKDEKYRPTAKIEIQDNCYIGGNCTIYPGVFITKSTIIGPNSAVTKSIDIPGLYGGVPAGLIKKS